MKVKGVSFSLYRTKLNLYILEKLDLFMFLFTQIILNESLNKDLKLTKCLEDLDIKEDLFYLFNNIYYTFIDNLLIDSEEKEFSELTLGDLKVKDEFVKYLKEGYLPVLKGKEEKDFVYDYLKEKIVLEKETYNDSNLCVLTIDNKRENIEKIINDNLNGLLNIDNGFVSIKDLIIDPYYFEISLDKQDNIYILKKDSSLVYDSLVENSLFINDTLLEGDFLSNNIYFKCLYGKEVMKDYCDYLFVNNKDNEGLLKGNIIYVNYEFKDNDFVDLVNKENYKCGYYLLKDDKKIATYLKEKNKEVSNFKLYLIKNKNKFKFEIEKIIDLL